MNAKSTKQTGTKTTTKGTLAKTQAKAAKRTAKIHTAQVAVTGNTRERHPPTDCCVRGPTIVWCVGGQPMMLLTVGALGRRHNARRIIMAYRNRCAAATSAAAS